MEDLYNRLEERILKIHEQYQTLSLANQSLTQANISLQQEKDLLLQQLQAAASYIENILMQLKSLETPL